jgi:hypothetical protein
MTEEIPIATCLDRARIALEQTGQIHCALMMGKLQEAISRGADILKKDPNKPVDIVNWIIDYFDDDYR